MSARAIARVACLVSAIRFRLRDVSFDFFEIDAEHSADKTATPIVHVHLWNRADVELLHNGCCPINDVDLAERDFAIASRHLFEAG